ncbi:His-Xaa-Ser system radical SAM maturase HxsB [Anaeromicropila herbilytica]|uniref:His-Xaa-Ser system radical SAM maturase HxsB n=1 Tax=Anaeromicropila herbilytica TaxID=2785025 RepID=A0A7R7ELQ8_9FIRM|nr:His-Xaa-Ser system radical SAM maturase HxsB [Anaeromicropila herbilytica]BCN31078.1 His-Xaa-Ser system radical SAM maturase HxsB [Anaeromicropila herbilytica]
MKNFFNFKRISSDTFLITNDFGRYVFLKKDDFFSIVNENEVKDSELEKILIDKGFIYESSKEAFLDKVQYYMKDSKQFLFSSTQLHIFVVTNTCNLQCVYCQAQNGSSIPNGFMDKTTAKKAVDIALQSPSKDIDFEFQGGEPLLNFEIIKYIVEYSKEKAEGKHIQYSIVSNLTLLTDEMIEFILENNINLSTSLDGNEILHNLNRPMKNGLNSFQIVLKSIEKLRQKGIYVGAIQTTTRESLRYAKEIVNAYVDNGFSTLSLRALTPLGCASARWKEIGYSPQEFCNFYKEAFLHMIQLNRQGIDIKEGQARVFLSKILYGVGSNYMELRSPCGAAIGQMAYYCDGKIYTCDEGRMLAEMGNDSFCLGTVDNTYSELIDSPRCKVACKASILETLPTCSDCIYQPYCGVCPVVNFASYLDVYEKRPKEYKCMIYAGMLDVIFNFLHLTEEEDTEILRRWM